MHSEKFSNVSTASDPASTTFSKDYILPTIGRTQDIPIICPLVFVEI